MYARHHIPPPLPQPQQPRVPPAEWLQAVVRAVRQLPGDPMAVFVQGCVEGPSPVSRRRQPRSDFSATLHTQGHRLPCSIFFVRFSDTSHQSIYEVTIAIRHQFEHRILLKVLQRKNRIDLSADNLFAMLQTAIERGMIEYMVNLDVISSAVFRGKGTFLDDQGSLFERSTICTMLFE
ncbi:hypothetical protein GGG16DRAFT_107542 [Schizophyllum commune]